MTTSTAIPAAITLVTAPGSSLLPAISRVLEGLWLLAVFLVPLTYLGQDYAVSEAQIAYVEVPKVALLRTVAGLIFLLWSIEWAIKSRSFQGSFPSFQTITDKLRPSKIVPAFNNWLRVHPTRWLLLAAGLFFGSTFLSTILSGSFTTSIWGEIPGQDGYSTYTIASYGILFGVIATHLKRRAQIGRLLGTVVLMGVLVGLYGALQHYGHDFLGVTEITGGGTARVTVFMGNTIFAAAVLAMTVPVTLMAAAIIFHDENWGNSGPLSKLGQLGRDYLFTSLWASILAVQLLGLMFTFGRGAWGGAGLALAVFLGLIVLSFGWRILIRTGLVLGLAGVLLVTFLHWQGSVSIVNVGPWLGLVLALIGLAGTFATLFFIKKFAWAPVLIGAMGASAIIAGALVLGPSALSNRGDPGATGGGSTASQVAGRIASIRTDVLGGFVGGRGTHWKVSWELIKNRPWFEFDELSLSWLRPLIGYGPDLFRYTYLLESPPDGRSLRPLEPDHAHNFFIHQTVEQGIFGGIASLALFASVFGVVGHHILRRLRSGNPVYRLLLFGLMAIIFGRFLEMMVGVARISDLTVLWIIFGLFATLVNLDDEHPEAAGSAESQSPERTGHRNRRRAARASAGRSFSIGLMFRLAIVAWLVGGIGVVTWQKSINSVRASVAEGRALVHFREGDFEKTVEELDKAIKLAPGVPSYHNNRAQVFLNYQLRPEIFTEPGCAQQNETQYLVCLGIQILESNLQSVNQQPFNYRARIAAGNAAFNLTLYDTASLYYADAVAMVPNAWPIRNDLAESLMEIGQYDEALTTLDSSLAITGESSQSTGAFYIKGQTLELLQRNEEAITALNRGLSLGYTSNSAQRSLDLIREISAAINAPNTIESYDRVISENPQDAVAYYLRGLAHLQQGDANAANLDIEKSFGLGLQLNETRANRGYARFKDGDRGGTARGDLAKAVTLAPENALFNAYWGEYQMVYGNYPVALEYMDNAITLDPDLGLAHLGISRTYLLLLGIDLKLTPDTIDFMGLAKRALDSSTGLELPTPSHYVERGIIHEFFDEFELALSDFDKAIQINPDLAGAYHGRANTYANRGDFQSALDDFNTAIQIDPLNGEYFIDRGVIYQIFENFHRSSADFDTANNLGWGTDQLEQNLERKPENSSYFSKYTLPTVALEESDIATYKGVLSLVPNAWKVRNNLAEALINLGRYDEAIAELDLSLGITGDLAESSSALELKKRAISGIE